MDESGDKIVQIGNYKVQVVRDLCIGAASCIAFSPTVFELDDENKAVFIEGGEDTPENLMLAAQSCPTKAIIIVDAESNEQVWPQ